MKPTKRVDLVAGKVYADINNMERAVLLEFVRHTETECLFKYVSGDKDAYQCKNEEGLIQFYKTEAADFFEVGTESE